MTARSFFARVAFGAATVATVAAFGGGCASSAEGEGDDGTDTSTVDSALGAAEDLDSPEDLEETEPADPALVLDAPDDPANALAAEKFALADPETLATEIDEDVDATPDVDDPQSLRAAGQTRLACRNRIRVVVANTIHVDRPTLLARAAKSGCWKPYLTHKSLSLDDAYRFRECSPNGSEPVVKDPPRPIHPIAGYERLYYYDDTSFAHGHEDVSLLRRCASHMPRRSGFEFLAFHGGGWRVIPVRSTVRAFFAEIYTSGRGTDADGERSAWMHSRLRRRGRVHPMFSMAASELTPRQIQRRLYALCRTLHTNGYLGIFAGEGVPLEGPRLRAMMRALDACTIKRK